MRRPSLGLRWEILLLPLFLNLAVAALPLFSVSTMQAWLNPLSKRRPLCGLLRLAIVDTQALLLQAVKKMIPIYAASFAWPSVGKPLEPCRSCSPIVLSFNHAIMAESAVEKKIPLWPSLRDPAATAVLQPCGSCSPEVFSFNFARMAESV